MNNIDIKYNVHNYTETHKQMQTILQQKQLISKENGTINFTMNGGKEVVKEIKDIIEYSKELKRQLNDVGKNSKLGQQLEQEITEQYDMQNVFANKKKKKIKNNEEENNSLVVYKETNIFKRLVAFIKGFFLR